MQMKKASIYLVGVVIFGFAYAWLKKIVGDPIFFASAICYLILLRLFAEKFGK